MSTQPVGALRALSFATVLAAAAAAPAQTAPSPPGTDRFSVQMFAGGTQLCWIAVYPPATYADGRAIPAGKGVQVRIYRSNDGGRTYTPTGVKVVGGGRGVVGQGQRDPRRKRWIDCKLKVPVDNEPPYAVWLAASAVVDGVESAKVNRFLQFRYRGDGGRPMLIRYERPDLKGPGVDDQEARPLPQELPGKWTDGSFTPREVDLHPEFERQMEAGEAEGCDEETMKKIKSRLGKSMRMDFEISEIDLAGAPAGGRVRPDQLKKTHFPGKVKILLHDPENKPKKPQKPETVEFDYDYENRRIVIEQKKQGALIRFAGHFFQTATHLTIVGTWKIAFVVEGKELFSIEGDWTTRKRKQ